MTEKTGETGVLQKIFILFPPITVYIAMHMQFVCSVDGIVGRDMVNK